MGATRWPVLSFSDVTRGEFVRFWERLYPDSMENYYQASIGRPLTDELIGEWFAWKNGKPLSAAKTRTVRRYFTPGGFIPGAADTDGLAEFLNLPGGVVWRSFWLHLHDPRRFPIYDQHVHRAMAYVLEWPGREIPPHNPAK